jgi:regulator of protease activity HflC (stomatin/prohibitin superfamily)
MPGVFDITGRLRVGVIVIGVLLVLYLSVTIVPAGHVGVQDFLGHVSDRILAPGINLVVPGTSVIKFSTQTRELKESANVPTSEGLVVNLDVSLLYRLQPDAAARIYKTVGRRFEQVVVDPQLRSAMRDVTAEYEAKFLYSSSREIVAQSMFKHMLAALAPRGIEAEQVLLRAVNLPPLLTTAIQEKLQAEQQAQRMRFVLDRERQEAESGWKPRASRTSRPSWPRASARSSSSGRPSRWPTSFPRARTRRSSCSGTRAACPSS